MNTVLEIARFAWDVIMGLGTLVALVWSWTLRRSAADAKSLAKLEAKLTERDGQIQKAVGNLDTRIGRVEERVAHLPTDKNISQIHESLARIGAQVGELNGEMRTVMRSVETMNRYLMERER